MCNNSMCDNLLNPIYLQNQLAIARKEIYNLRQQLITLNHVHRKECDSINRKLEQWQCMECRNRQSNAEGEHLAGATALRENDIDFQTKYIGTIRTHFPEKRGTPRQPGICADMIAKLVLNNNIFTNPGHALEGLQEFSHMWILFHFHKNEATHVRAKVAPPRLNGIRTGVFATRSPHRPGPIGLSLVKIDRIMENIIYFSGVDMIDQTPVLDIKPYIPQYDNPGLSSLFYPEECLLEADDEESDISGSVSSDRSFYFDATDGASNSEVLQDINDDLTNLNIRELDGEENGQREVTVGVSGSENNHPRPEELFYRRSSSRIGEREAPDGEEEESSRSQSSNNSAGTVRTNSTSWSRNSEVNNAQIQIPSWIRNSVVPQLNVIFKDRAIHQLSQMGAEGEMKKTAITNILREDPRSVYLRQRRGNHCYVFRIAELFVSCQFKDSNESVIVYRIFQDQVSPENGD